MDKRRQNLVKPLKNLASLTILLDCCQYAKHAASAATAARLSITHSFIARNGSTIPFLYPHSREVRHSFQGKPAIP
jgi:hypothetical protein